MKKFKKSILFFFLLHTSVTFSLAQSDTTSIAIASFALEEGTTHSWRGTGKFYDMTTWDSSPYTEGYLKEQSGSNWFFRMNYRLLKPVSYDSKYSQGYPLLIMLHGGGERGNCWDANCYCKDCNPNGVPDAAADPAFLNNDHMLMLGGQTFLNAVNLAGAKKAEDPTINEKAFPGFVLFPQNENFWGNPDGSNSPISYALRIVRLLVRDYNIDPDRIYVAGLSFGGQGVLKALNMADWMFAAAIAMSPVPYNDSFDYQGAVNIPLWIFQGGYDQNPKPGQTEALIEIFREIGGSVRYTKYADAGHNTWTRAFREPDLFSWMLGRKKNNIQVFYSSSYICATSEDGSRLNLPAGFAAYQWELNGNIIPGATEHLLMVKEGGKYRARFSRVTNPVEADWNEWSEQLEIDLFTPPAPVLKQIGTTFLPDLNGNNEARLITAEGQPSYVWEKNQSTAALPDTARVTIVANPGEYRVRTVEYSGCVSTPSNSKRVYFNDQAPLDNVMKPGRFTATMITSSSVYLNWNDPSPKETGYEIWRRRAEPEMSPWDLAILTEGDATFYRDTMLIPGSLYQYKIRAVNSVARSGYFPSDNVNENVTIVLPNENYLPQPPQNIAWKRTGVASVELTWEPGKDESGISEYVITYGNKTVRTGSVGTKYTIDDLQINQVYSARIQTVDITSNLSSPGNQVTFTTNMTGFFYKHSTGAWNSLDEATMKSTWRNPEYTGITTNVTLQPRVQEDYFNFEFDGYLSISNAGNYQFYLNSNDGSRLYLNGALVIDFDGHHGLCKGDANSTTCPNSWGKPSAAISLPAGIHRVRIEMFEYSGPQDLFFRYRGPDTGNSTVVVPDNRLTSGAAPVMNNPAVPVNISATAVSMTEIKLSWPATASVEYEVYRSVSSGGPFEIVQRVSSGVSSEKYLQPGKTYYYRLRAVTPTGSSAYSSVVSVKTLSDTQAPTIPATLQAENGNYLKTILKWDPSTDNLGVAGYEIWANGKKIGTSMIPAYEAISTEYGEIYEYYVIAYDASGNKSGKSQTVNNEAFYTDVKENARRGELKIIVFPNPSTPENLTIAYSGHSSNGAVRLIIMDVFGKRIHDEVYDPSNASENVVLTSFPNWKSGMYLISVHQGNQSVAEKVLITR